MEYCKTKQCAMGIGNFGITELLIILAIIALLFGTSKLRNIGGDLGTAIRSFRKGLNDEDETEKKTSKSKQHID
ncbi:MAG: twin-arginine translocase TatA/TatE family subunit [Gammaproteobacteria bacterium]